MPRRNTVPSTLRTFRMPIENVERLQEIADERGITLNSLLNKMTERFLNWGVFVERYGMVTLSKDTYRLLLDEIDPKRIPEMAKKALGYTEEFALLKYKKLSAETMLSVFQDYGHYANFGTTTMQKNGEEVLLTIHHPHGLNHSLLAKRIAEDLIEQNTGQRPQIMITENLAFCRFKMPQKMPQVTPIHPAR